MSKRPEQFTSILEERSRWNLLNTASYYTNPDRIDETYGAIADALAKFEVPTFPDEEDAANSFQALFETRLIDRWLTWLNDQLKEVTQQDMSLSEVSIEEVRRLTGGAIKGENVSRILTRANDGQRRLVVFGPYRRPVELYPTNI